MSAVVAFFLLACLKLQLLREVTNKQIYFFSSIQEKKFAFLPFTTPPSSTLNKSDPQVHNWLCGPDTSIFKGCFWFSLWLKFILGLAKNQLFLLENCFNVLC